MRIWGYKIIYIKLPFQQADGTLISNRYNVNSVEFPINRGVLVVFPLRAELLIQGDIYKIQFDYP